MTEYVLACGHRQYGETGRCAEMSCGNYVNKHDGEPPTREDREFIIETAALSLFVTEEQVSGVTQETHERALMLAEQFIERCGFDLKDSDQLGYEMGEIVHKKLAEVFLLIGLDSVMEAEL